jgi:5,10-methylenetetrahydromethanopterin reductase
MMTVQLSFGVSGGKPLPEYIALAQAADTYGFHILSIFDDLLFKPAWPILFAAAPHTHRLRIGPSVSNPYLVHPVMLAEYAAMLDEMTGGRAYLGIGRGAFLDAVHAATRQPITTVREAIEVIRHLWRGDTAAYDGAVFRLAAGARFNFEPVRPNLPIMVGTWGPKMCRMAGALADEVKAGSMWSDVYGRHMWEHIAAGAADAGRDPGDVGLVFGPLTSIAEDRDQAKAHVRQTLAFYLPYLAPMPAFAGMEPEAVARVQAATARGDMEAAVAPISDDILGHFALYGTPRDVIAEIERMTNATHVTRIEFGMPHGPDGSHAALQLLGQQVLPHFRQGA